MISVTLFTIFLCFTVKNIHGKVSCYPNFCHNVTEFSKSVSNYSCELTTVQRNKNCVDFKFENLGGKPQDGGSFGKFELNSYMVFSKKIIGYPAFNLTVKNITFHNLVTRYQAIQDKNSSHCRYIHLYENSTHSAPTELFVSCPFAGFSIENTSYQLEYLVVGKTYHYSRKLQFRVPVCNSIDILYPDNIPKYKPFIYVDVSDSDSVILYIQPAPKELNFTGYTVWFINPHANIYKKTIIAAGNNEEHIEQSYPLYEGTNFFEVAAMHANCSTEGCLNSTSIHIDRHPLTLLMVSLKWIPYAILILVLCLVCYAYKLYRKQKFIKILKKKPNCLLVYSPTRVSHTNVMIHLAKYLRRCNINAMIDVLDIKNNSTKDPFLWCSRSFHKADIVVVATSPKSNNTDVAVIYRNVDNHALRLLKENYPYRNKRYLTIRFPYCNIDDIPEEAKDFKRLNLPDDLGKLVSTIYNVNMRLSGVSSDELLKSIDDASKNVDQHVVIDGPKVYMDPDPMLFVSSKNEAAPLANEKEKIEIGDMNDNDKSDVIDPFEIIVNKFCMLHKSTEEEKDDETGTSYARFNSDELNL